MIDITHDASVTSWVSSANTEDTDFPLQNLPYGRFRTSDNADWRPAVAIGDQLLDLAASGFLASTDMQELLQRDVPARRALRASLSAALRSDSGQEAALRPHLHPQASVELGLPCDTRDYTDFYTGIHHARKVGQLLRPDNPLLPNYQWVPIGYHGRASSIVRSGTPIRRPRGQLRPPGSDAPFLAPSRRLDYELELGIIVGRGNALGDAVPLGDAESHVVGLTLLNDWSARDVQGWEYQPLGPFLAKNFATHLSPWIVTLEALAPFRRPFLRPDGDPQPLPYLDGPALRAEGMIDIELGVYLHTQRQRDSGAAPVRLSRSNYTDAYWALAQLVAHHTVNGCNLATGDLLGTGTLSGPAVGQGGSLLELSDGGRAPIDLGNGEVRTFLEDGDAIIMTGRCRREGFRRIGFGDCRGTILPAL